MIRPESALRSVKAENEQLKRTLLIEETRRSAIEGAIKNLQAMLGSDPDLFTPQQNVLLNYGAQRVAQLAAAVDTRTDTSCSFDPDRPQAPWCLEFEHSLANHEPIRLERHWFKTAADLVTYLLQHAFRSIEGNVIAEVEPVASESEDAKQLTAARAAGREPSAESQTDED